MRAGIALSASWNSVVEPHFCPPSTKSVGNAWLRLLQTVVARVVCALLLSCEWCSSMTSTLGSFPQAPLLIVRIVRDTQSLTHAQERVALPWHGTEHARWHKVGRPDGSNAKHGADSNAIVAAANVVNDNVPRRPALADGWWWPTTQVICAVAAPMARGRTAAYYRRAPRGLWGWFGLVDGVWSAFTSGRRWGNSSDRDDPASDPKHTWVNWKVCMRTPHPLRRRHHLKLAISNSRDEWGLTLRHWHRSATPFVAVSLSFC